MSDFYKTLALRNLRQEICAMKHFGDTLRDLISRTHFNNVEIAQQAGISADTLYRLLREKSPARRTAAYKAIAKALGLSPEQLDAAWMEAGADPAPPATEVPKEKTVMTLEDFAAWFEQLPPSRQKSVLGIVRAHVEGTADSQNKRSVKRARTASA